MRRWMLLVCWTIAILGCGDGRLDTYTTTGRVAFPDGRPLPGGTVEFQPVVQPAGDQLAGRVSARGLVQPDGTFTLSTFEQGDGAIAGEHRALVVPPLPPGRIDPTRRPKPVINARFQRYDTSGLKFTVTPDGSNEFEIIVEPPQ